MNLVKWFKRRRKHSYNDLWEMVYGHDQNKGLIREMNFYAEVGGMWKESFEASQSYNLTLKAKLEELGHPEPEFMWAMRSERRERRERRERKPEKDV